MSEPDLSLSTKIRNLFNPSAWSDYSKKVVYGRNDYPPKVRDILKKYGDFPIFRIVACRSAVPSLYTTALNALSLGEFKARVANLPYDSLFHLNLRIEIVDTSGEQKQMTTILVEKNEVINMDVNPKKPPESECQMIGNLHKPLTINQMMEGAMKIQGDKFYKYSAVDNNCQDFIMALLRGSNSGTEENYKFVKQNTEELFKGLPSLRRFVDTITDIGSTLNTAIQGMGYPRGYVIQSVVLRKDKYTKQHALDFIKRNGYKYRKIDETETQWRFRQLAPETARRKGFVNFRTLNMADDGSAQLILAYE